MEDIHEADTHELEEICKFNGYLDDDDWTVYRALGEDHEKKKLLKSKIKEKSKESFMKMPVSDTYVRLYSENYEALVSDHPENTRSVIEFLNLFFNALDGTIGNITPFLEEVLKTPDHRNMPFITHLPVMTDVGDIVTTKIAKQLLMLHPDIVSRTFGFIDDNQ